MNELTYKQFHTIFENIVECWPEAAFFVSALVPFSKVENISRAFDEYLERLNCETKIKIFKQFPHLTSKFLFDDSLAEDDKMKLEKLNHKYEHINKNNYVFNKNYNKNNFQYFQLRITIRISIHNLCDK